MSHPGSSGHAGVAARRLEQAWLQWRAVHGFTGPVDPPTSYVGRSLTEPMGRPRVVMGIDAAEAIRFADFLDRRADLRKPRPGPAAPGEELADSPPEADPVGDDVARWDPSERPRRSGR